MVGRGHVRHADRHEDRESHAGREQREGGQRAPLVVHLLEPVLLVAKPTVDTECGSTVNRDIYIYMWNVNL